MELAAPLAMELLEIEPEGIILFDSEFRIIYANAAARRISRIEPEHFNTRTHWELYPETVGTFVEDAYRRVQSLRIPEQLPDFYYAPFDVWVSARVTPLGDGFAVHYRDITEEHRLKEQKDDSDDRLRLALDAVNGLGTYDWDILEDRLYSDARFARIYGVDPVEAAKGAPLADFVRNILPEDIEHVAPAIENAIATTGEFLSEYRIRQADGSIKWVLSRGRVLRDDAGRPARFPGVVIDITEAKVQAERLRLNEERLRLILANGGMGTFDWNIDQNLFCADAVFARFYAIDPVVMARGVPVEDLLAHIHPDDLPIITETVERLLAEPSAASADYRLRRPDGSIIWLHFASRALPGPTGKPARILGYVTDITRRKQTESALLQSEKLAAVGRLASSIAHEINNPLEAVTNLIFLARHTASNPSAEEYLATAEQELRRVAIIANQTLRFHKQSTGPIEISCSDLFSTVLTLYEGRLRNSGIHIEKRKRAKRLVSCFEGDVRQVLNNLVGNALDAMPLGGRLILRSREATDPAGRQGLVLTVADTGTGIPVENRDRLFEPFFTTKGFNGTGLGLWISTDIVARHHGSLRLRSSQNPRHQGTVFSVFLPFDAPPPTTSEQQNSNIAPSVR